MAYFTSKLGTKINVGGLQGQQLNRVQKLANRGYGTKAAGIANKFQTKIPKVGINPITEPTPPTTAVKPINFSPPGTVSANPGMPNAGRENANTLFPNTRMFEPQNYEGSPLYKFQVQEGQNQLTRSLAARGLSNSGKAIRDELNIPMMAAAQDTDRMTRVASENADRLQSMQQNEALRLERAGDNQWSRAFSLADLMASQSPWAAGLAGLNNSADLRKGKGDAKANYLRDAYGRVFGGGGGGGGAARAPVPLPAGPNYTNLMPAQIAANGVSNNGWMDILTSGLGGLFGDAK